LENSQKQKMTRFSAVLTAVVIIVSALAGGLLSYSVVSKRVNDLQNQVSTLQEQLTDLQPTQNVTYIVGYNASLSELYEEIKESIVLIRGVVHTTFWGETYYSQVQGSGFVYNFNGNMVVLTNYHVVNNAVNISVTFINGNGYAATVLGSDPYADLAVLSTDAPQSEYVPLEIVSSSTLKVGDPVIAVGNPYGLTGSATTGIVSQLGRTITEETAGGFPIADVVQMTASINPGNSGGPLLNYRGQVVGITTAILSDSQGLGFAIPSNTILREIESLVNEGSYNRHPWLGAVGVDVTYEVSNVIDINVTYGWLIVDVVSGGPSDKAGLRGGSKQVLISGEQVAIGGDIIIEIDGTRITSIDNLSTYLEENTLPGQTINVKIVRGNQTMYLPVELGTRPPPGAP
jgi:S1-C subfamily serine protease